MSATDIPRSSSPSLGWRGRLMPRKQSQDKPIPAKEVSRWSKTTTESELSEAGVGTAAKGRTLPKKKIYQRKQSKDTAKSSPIDPFYNPLTKQLQPFGAESLPPIVTTSRDDGTEQSRTILDEPSDDETVDSPTSPVIQRASSVRVSRPQIIQHSNSSAASAPKLYAPQNTPSSMTEASIVGRSSQTLGEDLKDRLAPRELAQGGPTEALRALEGEDTEELTALPQQKLKETLVSWPDTPSRLEALDTMPTPMGGFGSMRIPRTSDGTFSTTSTNTYVSPPSMTDGLRANPPTESDKALSRAISAPVRNSRRVMIRPADLVINKAGHDHKLFRESIVSTPYPARHSSQGEIHVMLAGTPPSDGQPKVEAKRTPRLRRSRPLSHTIEHAEPDDASADITSRKSSSSKAPEIPLHSKPSPAITSKSDRFPSPSAPEVLFLDLRLACHSSGAKVTVEITIADKATFDDEQLFAAVRKAYVDQLMGKARWWLCARRVEGVSLLGEATSSAASSRTSAFWHGHQQHLPTLSSDFDSADFVRHLLNPRLGHRRKAWLLWLRNNQYQEAPRSASSSRRGPRTYPPQSAPYGLYNYGSEHDDNEKSSSSPVFSFMHSRQNSAGNQRDVVIDIDTIKGEAGVGSAEKSTLSHQPSTSLPRMPFSSPSTQPPLTSSSGGGLTSFHRSKSLALSASASYPPTPAYQAPPSSHSSTIHPSGPPTILLHHTFSLRLIGLVTLLTLLFALLTTILWVLLGYPGRSAAQGNGTTTVAGQEYTVEWRRDAQARVGVGLIMGVVVVLVGGLCEVAWVWGSWVLV